MDHKEYAIVKFTVDLFAPGAYISPTLTNWIAQHVKFHSRRTVWPVRPIRELMDIDHDGSTVKEDFFHIRVTSIMDGYDGVTDGPLDHMMTIKPVHEIFDIPLVTNQALMMAQPYETGFTRAGWVNLYEVQEDAVTFVRLFPVGEMHRLATEAPTE